MAIRHRRGDYNNFEPNKMVAGELAFVNSSDPNTEDGKAVYGTFTGGRTKRLCTYDEVSGLIKHAEDINADVEQLKADVEDIKDETEQIKESTSDIKDEAEDFAELSKSYAVGTGGVARVGDDEDNAKYYKEWVEDAFERKIPTVYLDFSSGLLMYTGSAISFDIDETTGMLEWNM